MTKTDSSNQPDLFSLPGVMRASQLVASSKPGKTAPEWHDFFSAVIRQELPAGLIARNPYQTAPAVKQLYNRVIKKAPVDREWAALFQLYAATYIASAILKQAEEPHTLALASERAASDVLFFLLDEVYEAAHRCSSATSFSFEPFLTQLRTSVTRLLSAPFERLPEVRFELYRVNWDEVFTKPEWRTEEISRLLDTGLSSPVQYSAMLHQLYITGDLDRFQTIAASSPPDVFPSFLYWLQEAKQSGHLIPVARAAALVARSGIFSVTHDYSRRLLVRQIIREISDSRLPDEAPSLVKELYTAMLPFSYAPLSFFLLETADYAEWAELQLYMQTPIEDLDRSGLKTIVKEAPVHALPLFHHGIITLINERNRASYKKAVRYLKRLRTIYKKEKQLPAFEKWLHWLTVETKRLRAFQEECKKGGLTE